MAMGINTNVSSLNAQRALSTSQSSLQTSMQRLSTGLRVNGAKDDAAGMSIADRMNAQVKGMNQAMRNANDGISMLQTVDGALGKITDSMQRMRELAVQGANETNSAEDRTNLSNEFKALQSEVSRVIESTKFNGIGVLNGDDGGVDLELTFQIGANNEANVDQINITIADLKVAATEVATAVDGTTTEIATDHSVAQVAIENIDAALEKINTERSKYGATQNRFEAVVSNLQIASENTAASRGRIIDADFATETANLSRAQVLQQAGTAMLSQANQSTQNVMQLLR